MVIKICITEKPGGLVDLSISPELSNCPLFCVLNRVDSIDLPRDMVGEMIQKYIDKGGEEDK